MAAALADPVQPGADVPEPPAAPQTAGPAETLERAKWLIFKKRPDEARKALEGLALNSGKMPRQQVNEVQFLIGLIDITDEDYPSAISHFRRILASDPGAVRVRLELGRAFFLNDDYNNARRQFLFARAGDVPATVRENIDRYLVAIRSLRTTKFTFSISLASDTNLNAGPSADTITIYGLPFQLSKSARANSGTGLAIDAGAEYAPRIAKRLKWRMGAQLHRAQYRYTEFDDMTMSAYTGPHLTLRKWDFNLLATAARRWYGNHVYTDIFGGRVSATYFVTSRLGIGAALAVNHLNYLRYTPQSGTGGNVSMNMFYTPSTSSILRARATLGRQDAKDKAFANHLQQFNVSVTKELGSGFTVTASPTYSRIAYDARLAAFDRRRIDHQFMGSLTVLNRKIDVLGITPRIVYSYTDNASSIPLYRYTKHRVEVGLTTQF
ncbi:surface lipoprotein assembly modifier [Novosphingobium mangrovi (ex Huang et al. 2023)]|uniref:Surface lipoprotein assembly modifier n=1 Tax=Novosphingobium mangrovi (ex Huang et al. 2023) TaxID=2976432 RepID=A0ABT2I1J3_9SPHN|nr:surface lipoprotein assembly modifier [Novosphingobium mangrovi (ex Huang et al. 2023)]MCT2398664.1 surface lipoprotein assembly modifier [Novosphingobium mangrovi (ex Huang et al. 2023)]